MSLRRFSNHNDAVYAVFFSATQCMYIRLLYQSSKYNKVVDRQPLTLNMVSPPHANALRRL